MYLSICVLSSSSTKLAQVYYSAENNATDQDTIMRESLDGGKTWGPRNVVTGGNRIRSRDGMTSVARLGPGNGRDGDNPRLILFFETNESGRFDLRRVLSDDDGKTWR